MSDIEFIHFDQAKLEELLPVLNEQELRTHLVEHEEFSLESIGKWAKEKADIDSLPGCRLRIVLVNGVTAGWCGIQPDENGFEIAIVISKRFWGEGIPIFRKLLGWAAELGHKEVLFHLLDSRPEYKSLKRMSSKVETNQLLGRNFTTYYIAVSADAKNDFASHKLPD